MTPEQYERLHTHGTYSVKDVVKRAIEETLEECARIADEIGNQSGIFSSKEFSHGQEWGCRRTAEQIRALKEPEKTGETP